MPIHTDIRKLLSMRWVRVFLVLAALLVIAIAVFGGLRAAAPSSLMTRPPLPAGVRIDAGALALTPLRAWVTMQRPNGIADPGHPQQYLLLQVRVENMTNTGYSAASYLSSDLVLFTDPIDAPGIVRRRGEEPGVRTSEAQTRADDHSFSFSLQPGLPVDLDLAWSFPANIHLPPQMAWGIVGRDFVEQTYLTRESGWISGRGKARWELPVEDRRSEAVPQ